MHILCVNLFQPYLSRAEPRYIHRSRAHREWRMTDSADTDGRPMLIVNLSMFIQHIHEEATSSSA